ncbi:MAG: phosphate starvation-inducible protein PhoH, partial [Acidobacteriota bacterium]
MASLTLAEGGIETLFGTQDENLRKIERGFHVVLAARGTELIVSGDDPDRVASAERFMSALSGLLEQGYRFKPGDVQTALRVALDNPEASLAEFFLADGLLAAARRMVQPRTLNQQAYMKAMLDYDIVISIGPAG